MDRSRTAILIAAAAVSLGAALFAVGAAVTSEEDAPAAAPSTVAPVGASSTTAAAATARLDVEIAGFEFGPAEVTVQVGTEVVWTNNDGVKHSVVSVGGGFTNSPTLDQGDTYSFVFTAPGTYEYFCGQHDNMRGTITVEA